MDPSSDPSMSRSQFFLFAVVPFETIITFMHKNDWIENYFPEILIMNFLEHEIRLRTTFLYWRLTPEEKKINYRNCSSATLIRFVAMQGRILADFGLLLSSYSPEVIYSHFTSSTEGNKDSMFLELYNKSFVLSKSYHPSYENHRSIISFISVNQKITIESSIQLLSKFYKLDTQMFLIYRRLVL